MEQNISRRELLRNAAVFGGAVAAGTMLSGVGSAFAADSATSGYASTSKSTSKSASGSASASKSASGDASSIQWDKECDVLIIGYGGAGAATAITACDEGAEVLIIEKMAVGGGNTCVSTGGFLCPDDADKSKTYISKLFEVSYSDMDESLVDTFIPLCMENCDWITSLNPDYELLDYGGAGYADVDGADAMHKFKLVDDNGTNGGDLLFGTYQKAVETDRGIEVMLNTPARRLITDATGQVIGAIASPDGGDINIKARKAVVLTCGGYEFDAEMLQNNIKGYPISGLGNPGNSGDGVRMAQAVGAGLWHMNESSGQIGFKEDSTEAAHKLGFGAAGRVWVNQDGVRFVNELGVEGHGALLAVDFYDTQRLDYPNIPVYLVFDETARTSGPVCADYGYAARTYTWSDDNSAEVDAGWIKKGDTIEDLAGQIGVDPATLASTIDTWNTDVAAGTDSLFARPITKKDTVVSAAISTAPFYAIELTPALLNTQGGPRRNSDGNILDAFGDPIPRLYSAGELGSFWGLIYQGAGNNAESIVWGRIAGKNAATLDAWD